MLKRQKGSYFYKISFARTRKPTSLLDRVKIWRAYIGHPFLPKFCPKVTRPCWFECQEHSMANCGRMVRECAMITIESMYEETTVTLFILIIANYLQPPFLKMGVPNAPPGPNLWRLLPPGKHDGRFLVHTTVQSSDVAFCQMTLAIIIIKDCVISCAISN